MVVDGDVMMRMILVLWLMSVWCKHCQTWHDHGPAEGHREAHCQDWTSPYWKNGYNPAYAGKWRGRPKRAAWKPNRQEDQP